MLQASELSWRSPSSQYNPNAAPSGHNAPGANDQARAFARCEPSVSSMRALQITCAAPRAAELHARDFERARDHLVHVVILILREAAAENDVAFARGQRLIARVQFAVRFE